MVVVKPAMAPQAMSVPRSRRLWVTAAVPSPPTQSAAAYAPSPPVCQGVRTESEPQGQGSELGSRPGS